MLTFILFIALIVAVIMFGLSALTTFGLSELGTFRGATSGILRARDHDLPYQRGRHIRFADVVSERAYSKRTGQVGPAHQIAINDRTTRGRALPQESYPRPVSDAV